MNWSSTLSPYLKENEGYSSQNYLEELEGHSSSDLNYFQTKLKTYPHSKTPVVLDPHPLKKKIRFHYIHKIFTEIALC